MKSQAETAARLFRATPKVLEKGSVIPDFDLLFADGSRQLLSQFRGRSNLVIAFVADHDIELPALLGRLAAQAHKLKANESKVLVIASQEHFSRDPQPVAVVNAAATLPFEPGSSRLIITDRFGEIFASFPNERSAVIPTAEEVIRWLEFINQQCEECSPPEWQE
jgi:hypothetical protein